MIKKLSSLILLLLICISNAFADEVHMTPKAEGGHGNITISDWTSNQILTWTAGSYNHIDLQGLPTGDLSDYSQLVVVSSSANGEGEQADASAFRILIYYGNDGKNVILQVGELGTYTYNLSQLGVNITNVTRICVAGLGASGSVKIDDVYLVESETEEVHMTPKAEGGYGNITIDDWTSNLIITSIYRVYQQVICLNILSWLLFLRVQKVRVLSQMQLNLEL